MPYLSNFYLSSIKFLAKGELITIQKFMEFIITLNLYYFITFSLFHRSIMI
jgi:hypothetical protein